MILLIGSWTPVFSRNTGNDVYTARRAYKVKFWRERRGRKVPEITVQHVYCNTMGKCCMVRRSRLQRPIMTNITWSRFDQSAQQLVVGHTTKTPVTLLPPSCFSHFLNFSWHVTHASSNIYSYICTAALSWASKSTCTFHMIHVSASKFKQIFKSTHT